VDLSSGEFHLYLNNKYVNIYTINCLKFNFNNLKQSKIFNQKKFLFFSFTKLVVFTIAVFIFSPLFSQAQTRGDFGVAYSYKIIDENFEYGDIISYDKGKGIYSLSKKNSDSNMFGVAVEDPVLLFRSGDEKKVPIVQSGKALVNVTTLNGPIKTGDYITTSSLPGKGQKASGKNIYVLGFALESFGNEADTEKDNKILSGKVLVMLNVEEKKDASSGSGLNIPFFGGEENKGLGVDAGDGSGSESDGDGKVNAIKYTVAAIIAIASIFIALRNFMTVVKKGVVSVGRNPLAKSSVWSIVVLNTIIALVISVIGIFLSLIVISLPF